MNRIHYRLQSEGRKAFTPPAGSVGIDRSLFDLARPTQAGALALIGAIVLGKTLSIWAEDASHEAKDAAKSELLAKVAVATAMVGWDGQGKVRFQDL